MSKTKSKVTISDVAALAGVSKTTVSRFINGNLEMMSEQTRENLSAIIEELNYRPSRVAQTLKSKHSRMIGCVIADITSSFSTHLVKGVSDICEKNNYRVLFINTNNDSEVERQSVLSLLDSRVDGLIINTTGGNDDFIFDVNRTKVPVVLSDRYLDTDNYIDTISSTNFKGTYECIQHLHEAGYDKTFFFQQSLGINRIREIRHEAYKEACWDFYKTRKESSFTVPSSDSVNTIASILKNLKIKNPNSNMALFAVNGMMLIDIIIAMKELNFEIGKDFGICGVDNWFWADLIGPGITTVEQDSYLIGSQSAQRLLNKIDGEFDGEAILVELPTKLIKRGSTIIQK